MNYNETIEYLYRALPMFSRVGDAAIKKDLTNTRILCGRLDDPQQKFKTIHVAGTNGKGSVSHMLAAVLQQSGYITGLYTSPHLHDFRERIKVNGEMVSKQFVVDFTECVQSWINEIQPSFFETTVAMAFEYFAEMRVDVAVIETGLGGRLDSTNIILPELSVITNIGMDHMHILGDSLPKIAAEKAGIIKDRVPVVIGETREETMPVFVQAAKEKAAPLYAADRERYADAYRYKEHTLEVTVVRSSDNEKQVIPLDLTGLYQAKNLLTVLSAVDCLREKGWIIPEDAMLQALHSVKKLTGLHGRWELIHHAPAVVLDVGHNEDGIRQVCMQIEALDYHELHIIIGMVKDKAIEPVLQLLPKEANYYFTRAQIPRALPEDHLAIMAAAHGLNGHHYPNVNAALKEALDHATGNDLIVVCGSVFVVGEVDSSQL
ncbi:MAG: bifunctional folylpolyglutamate synthase/dihydrofolate synthase [Sphingobacteriales bacterium]|nr:bifunctional folylpolyglutamate synthase/dihydrofolate synthase [Sphingobacteriales bacterium]OJY87544.1 MAG: dihydrofolate synthase [Sphingobacteriales bacterium 44-15]